MEMRGNARWIAVALGLVLFENCAALLTGGELFLSGWLGIALTVGLVAGLWLVARRFTLSRFEIGLGRRRALRSAAVGLLVAGAIAGGAVAVLHSGILTGGPVTYAPFAAMPLSVVLVRALVWVPLATAIPEELAFRGVLLALVRRRHGTAPALLASAAAFALWHGMVVLHTLGQTSLAATPLLWSIGCAGAFAAVAAGGVIFAWIRLSTGSLAGSIACHWVFDAGVMLALYSLR